MFSARVVSILLVAVSSGETVLDALAESAEMLLLLCVLLFESTLASASALSSGNTLIPRRSIPEKERYVSVGQMFSHIPHPLHNAVETTGLR